MKKGAERSENRKAQFYLIAAIVIVFVIVSFAVVSNYIYVKNTSQNFYDIGGVLKLEGIQVVENAEYTDSSVSDNINSYLTLFESYLKEHSLENFDLIIVYGDFKSGEVKATRYSTNVSKEGVRLSIGGGLFEVAAESGRIKKEQAIIVPNSGSNTVNVTLTSEGLSITQTLPILQDNNFVFIMTTSDGFSNYVQTSLSQQTQG